MASRAEFYRSYRTLSHLTFLSQIEPQTASLLTGRVREGALTARTGAARRAVDDTGIALRDAILGNATARAAQAVGRMVWRAKQALDLWRQATRAGNRLGCGGQCCSRGTPIRAWQESRCGHRRQDKNTNDCKTIFDTHGPSPGRLECPTAEHNAAMPRRKRSSVAGSCLIFGGSPLWVKSGHEGMTLECPVSQLLGAILEPSYAPPCDMKGTE
jgi:hypothetical protein